MAQINEIDIAGLEGNMQAQPRVFAHSAVALTVPTGGGVYVDMFNTVSTAPAPTPADGDSINVLQRGACLYVGTGGTIKVLLEGDQDPVTFVGVAAGSFLPILALRVYSDTDGTTADNILALF